MRDSDFIEDMRDGSSAYLEDLAPGRQDGFVTLELAAPAVQDSVGELGVLEESSEVVT